jgi:hypothetical protein
MTVRKLPEKSSSGHRLRQAILPSNLREMAAFVTCDMLRPGLEMYSSAPIKDTGRPERPAVHN